MHIVRQVLPTEFSKYRDHLKRLDTHSRRLRFSIATSDKMIDKNFASIESNKAGHILFCVEDYNLDFIGVAHLALGPPAELAFSVVPEYQGQGIGSALMERVVQYSRAHNIKQSHIMCLSTNNAVRRMCKKYSIQIELDNGESTGTIDFGSINTPGTLGETAYVILGYVDYMAKRTFYPLTLMTQPT